jgi:hypothetical protein
MPNLSKDIRRGDERGRPLSPFLQPSLQAHRPGPLARRNLGRWLDGTYTISEPATVDTPDSADDTELTDS